MIYAYHPRSIRHYLPLSVNIDQEEIWAKHLREDCQDRMCAVADMELVVDLITAMVNSSSLDFRKNIFVITEFSSAASQGNGSSPA